MNDPWLTEGRGEGRSTGENGKINRRKTCPLKEKDNRVQKRILNTTLKSWLGYTVTKEQHDQKQLGEKRVPLASKLQYIF